MTVHVATFLPGGERLAVRDGETLDGALVRAGFVRPQRGCRRGGCGKCMGRVHAGTTVDERPIATTVLSDEQRRSGHVLLCRAVPITDVTVELVDGAVRCVSPVQRVLADKELPRSSEPTSTGGT